MNKIISKFHQLFQQPLLLSFIAIAFIFINLFFLLPLIQPEKKDLAMYLSPPSVLALKGQEVYAEAGCQYCHTQALDLNPWELKRFSASKDKMEKNDLFPLIYSFYSSSMENFFDTPSVRGSKRIGPDLSHVALTKTKEELKRLLNVDHNPKDKYFMHKYYYLFQEDIAPNSVWFAWKLKAMLQTRALISEPYTRSMFEIFEGKTKGDALVHYLLNKGKKYQQIQEEYYQP